MTCANVALEPMARSQRPEGGSQMSVVGHLASVLGSCRGSTFGRCRCIMRPTLKMVIPAFVLLACVSCAAPPSENWKLYSGAWFDVTYPATFRAVPVQKSETSFEGFDSARFVSPSGDVEFYVYSPQWAGHASALDIDPHRERITSQKISTTDYQCGNFRETNAIKDTWLCIVALDKSYVRFVHHHSDHIQNGDLVFGITCKDMSTYSRYRNDYRKFRDSLVQYAD